MHQLALIFLLCCGVISAAFGLGSFLLPNGFIDGGVTGISMLVSAATQVELSILLVVINIPFVLIGYRVLGLQVAVRASIGILFLAVILHAYQFPVVTTDKLLAAVFGGCFLGAGIGLAMRANAVLDGTEIIAFIIRRKTGFSVGDIVLTINIAIFSVAAWLLGIEPALYSILTYMSASKAVDFLIHGLEEFSGLLIFSEKNNEIRQAIVKDLGRGVSIFKGKGGMSEAEQNILFCVVTRFEIHKVQELVATHDENAFVVAHKISDVSGGVVPRMIRAAELH